MELKHAFDSENREANEPYVVCAKESEHNPRQASLKALTGDHVKKPQFYGCVHSYSYSYYVLPEYSLPQSKKLHVLCLHKNLNPRPETLNP